MCMLRKLLTLAVIAALGALTLVACAAASNPAQEKAAAVIAGLAPSHATLHCDNGDNGRGIDNRIPWHTAYLTADATNAESVIAAARASGWHLTTDESAIRIYEVTNGDPGQSSASHGRPLAGVPYRQSTVYLADRGSDWQLVVDVVHEGSVTTYCRDIDTYGHPISPAPDHVVIVVQVSGPEQG